MLASSWCQQGKLQLQVNQICSKELAWWEQLEVRYAGKLKTTKKLIFDKYNVEIYYIQNDLTQLEKIPYLAKTILSNINNIRKIKFDFNNVDLIGPAFADELIRGLNKKEKAIEVQWINSNEMIDIMMSHAVERFS